MISLIEESNDIIGNRTFTTYRSYKLYYTPNINTMIISRTMIWAGHEARVKNINTYKNMVEKIEGKLHLEKLRN
jgi:hypothetical protein